MANNGAAGATAGDTDGFHHPGNRLGMPEDGSGSVPTVARRLAALCVDWALCTLVVNAFLDAPMEVRGYAVLLVFAAQAMLLVTFTGTTVGKRLLGIRMAALSDSRLPWPLAVVVRTVLLCLVIPAVIYDRDQRGLHDRAAGMVSTRI